MHTPLTQSQTLTPSSVRIKSRTSFCFFPPRLCLNTCFTLQVVFSRSQRGTISDLELLDNLLMERKPIVCLCVNSRQEDVLVACCLNDNGLSANGYIPLAIARGWKQSCSITRFTEIRSQSSRHDRQENHDFTSLQQSCA